MPYTSLASLARCLTLAPKAPSLTPPTFIMSTSSSAFSAHPSSSRKSIFLRAASPAAHASAQAAVRGGDVGSITSFTTHAIATAANLDDVIVTIPSRFRALLAPTLRGMHTSHASYCNASRALASLIEAKDNGTWPSFLPAMSNPFDSIQVTKVATPTVSPLKDQANDWYRSVKSEALSKFIELKKAEVETLKKHCSPPSLETQILEKLKADWISFEKSMGRHVLPADENGKEQETGVKIPKFIKDEYALAQELTPVWVAKCWDFTRVKTQKLDAAMAKKKDLAARAADPMDLDPPNLQKVVDAAVKSALAASGGPRTDTRARRPQVHTPHSIPTYVTNSSLAKRKSGWTEEGPRRRQKHLSPSSGDQEIPEECPRHQYQEATTRCLRCGNRPGEEEGQAEQIVRACKWNPTKPSSIPKQILDLPEEQALLIIQSRINLSQVVTADLNVKLGPGVSSIPAGIDRILSLGHRFLFPSTFSLELPLVSYMSLARRVKWQVYYYYLRKEPSFLDQYPQFRLSKDESHAVPETTPLWVVTMLEKGRQEMLRQIEAIPSTTVNTPANPKWGRDITQLRDWRKNNNLLVLQSDKNLGTTVVSSEWYSSKLDNLVRNNPDFVEISEVNYFKMILTARAEIESYENPYLPTELKEYILANCDIASAEKHLPKFHGLPKVHKDPWALRPIVPCHSYPLANASKVLSTILKLQVRESPWILESTQDLARLLEATRLDQSKKYWLCTGDVTAMYPNIPRKRAHQILGVNEFPEDQEQIDQTDLVVHLAQWSDNFLAFRHENKIFYQKDGLAMGIPAAPDVANLYMSHFEDSFAGKFPLYKRYIDDIIVLVEAPTYKEARAQLDCIAADNLELTWTVDKKTINFLDLSISQEAGYLSFKPYRKPLNSYERLPYTSFHPQHVKRAAFCGEVSRVARLCSNHNTYYNEVAYVRDIYLKRGYPNALLHNWIRAEARNRWDSRYTDAPEAKEVSALWLKSEYNDVWKHIDLHKVWSAMMSGRVTKPLPLANITDVKLSLKRLRNLGEMSNKYNADVLKASRVEENEQIMQQAVEPIQPATQPAPPQLMKWGKWDQTTINFPKV